MAIRMRNAKLISLRSRDMCVRKEWNFQLTRQDGGGSTAGILSTGGTTSKCISSLHYRRDTFVPTKIFMLNRPSENTMKRLSYPSAADKSISGKHIDYPFIFSTQKILSVSSYPSWLYIPASYFYVSLHAQELTSIFHRASLCYGENTTQCVHGKHIKYIVELCQQVTVQS